jgi:hypothetical protein
VADEKGDLGEREVSEKQVQEAGDQGRQGDLLAELDRLFEEKP